MANRSRSHSEKSTASSPGYLTGNTDMEYFWCFELSDDQRTFKWAVKCEDEDDDEDFIEHTIFVKLAVLDGVAVAGEQNIVVFESDGQDGELQKGTIANLTKEVNPMATLNISINGKIGGTFTLSEGNGPVTISGNHYLGFPRNENLDISQAELDNNESAAEEEDDKKNTQSVKRKVSSVGTKRKKSNKDDNDTDDDDDDDLEEEDVYEVEVDDDDDDESEEEIKMKPAKKVKDTGKKVNKKPDKDAAKKPMKKQKK